MVLVVIPACAGMTDGWGCVTLFRHSCPPPNTCRDRLWTQTFEGRLREKP